MTFGLTFEKKYERENNSVNVNFADDQSFW